MSKYIGAECPACGKIFAKDDDIVVCPECGAPHHRECYSQAGHCALEALHGTGKEWKGQERQDDESTGKDHYPVCLRCGSHNPPDGLFCQTCGARLNQYQNRPPYQHSDYDGHNSYGNEGQYNNQNRAYYQGQQGSEFNAYAMFMSPYGGADPEMELDEGVKVKEAAAFVGRASNIYMPRFAALSQSKSGLSWNWSSLIFGFLYFFYRKMYKIAVPLMILFIFSLIPAFAYSYEYLREMVAQYGRFVIPLPSMSSEILTKLLIINNFTRIMQIGISIIVAIFANKLYYNHVITSINKIKQSGAEKTSDYIQKLNLKGGVSAGMVWLIMIGLFILYISGSILLSYFLLP